MIGYAAWEAWNRPVRLADRGAAIYPASRPDWPDMRIDINAASAAELALLPGLGPGLAQRIVEDRRVNGAFGSVDELDRVSGIGPAIVERVRPYALVVDPSGESPKPSR
jgi:competence ComEA-like helix-hairpin-helix protein